MRCAVASPLTGLGASASHGALDVGARVGDATCATVVLTRLTIPTLGRIAPSTTTDSASVGVDALRPTTDLTRLSWSEYACAPARRCRVVTKAGVLRCAGEASGLDDQQAHRLGLHPRPLT